MARTNRLAALALSAAVLSVAGNAAAGAASAPSLVKGSSGPLSATLKPSTHTPKINTNWRLTVTATLNGKPAAHASAAYEFLFGGVPVGGTQYPFRNPHYTFTGHFSDYLTFPAAAVGQPLTLRVVVKAGGHTVNLPWSISPHS